MRLRQPILAPAEIRLEGDIQALIERMVGTGYARPDELLGCTPEEVARIEARFGLRLPRIYREFLLAMGRGAGRFFRGTDVFSPAVLELRQWAEELLEECGRPCALPDDAFVFLMHQGYQFGYFRTGGGEDDPPLYRYVECDPAPVQNARSFSEMLRAELESHIATWERLSPDAKAILDAADRRAAERMARRTT